MFCTDGGSPLSDTNLVKRHFIPSLRKAKLRGIRFHDLRHTNVALRIARGQEIKYISEQLGHSTVQFTLDVYGHLMPTHRQQEAKKMEDYLYGHEKGTEPENQEKRHSENYLSACNSLVAGVGFEPTTSGL